MYLKLTFLSKFLRNQGWHFISSIVILFKGFGCSMRLIRSFASSHLVLSITYSAFSIILKRTLVESLANGRVPSNKAYKIMPALHISAFSPSYGLYKWIFECLLCCDNFWRCVIWWSSASSQSSSIFNKVRESKIK